MKNLLRYNSRHRVWFPRGYEGKIMPQLNPIASCSHGANGKLTWSFNEPLWLYRLRQRVFCFGGFQRCGRRRENPIVSRHFGGDKLSPDTWDLGPDGFRTCSYCGSLHFDDFIEICRRAIGNPEYAIEPSDKSYKIYVRQPKVRNAGEGAIKYYTAHSPEKVSLEHAGIYVKAVDASNARFAEKMKKQREKLKRDFP